MFAHIAKEEDQTMPENGVAERHGGRELLMRPIADLPPIDADVVPGQEFWSRENMRPEGEGFHFRNVPFLDIGITFRDDGNAVLSIPSREEYNALIETHNPGSFVFVPGNALEKAPEFLAKLSRKQFPWSTDRDTTFGVPSYFRQGVAKFHGRPADAIEQYKLVTNAVEHNITDHGAIGLMAPSEADKLAALADYGRQSDEVSQLIFAQSLDAILSYFSNYATLPAEYPDDLEVYLKEYAKDHIRGIMLYLSDYLPEDLWTELDFDVLDANIQRLQAIEVETNTQSA